MADTPTMTDPPSYEAYDTVARLCDNVARDQMIEVLEQLPNGNRIVAAIADIAEHDGTHNVSIVYGDERTLRLRLAALEEAVGAVDVLAHAAGFEDAATLSADEVRRVHLSYDLHAGAAPEVA